jgi:hypothetical protein
MTENVNNSKPRKWEAHSFYILKADAKLVSQIGHVILNSPALRSRLDGATKPLN